MHAYIPLDNNDLPSLNLACAIILVVIAYHFMTDNSTKILLYHGIQIIL